MALPAYYPLRSLATCSHHCAECARTALGLSLRSRRRLPLSWFSRPSLCWVWATLDSNTLCEARILRVQDFAHVLNVGLSIPPKKLQYVLKALRKLQTLI